MASGDPTADVSNTNSKPIVLFDLHYLQITALSDNASWSRPSTTFFRFQFRSTTFLRLTENDILALNSSLILTDFIKFGKR